MQAVFVHLFLLHILNFNLTASFCLMAGHLTYITYWILKALDICINVAEGWHFYVINLCKWFLRFVNCT